MAQFLFRNKKFNTKCVLIFSTFYETFLILKIIQTYIVINAVTSIRKVPVLSIRNVPVRSIRKVPVLSIRKVPVRSICKVPVLCIRKVPVRSICKVSVLVRC
jgi:hypothetical protein